MKLTYRTIIIYILVFVIVIFLYFSRECITGNTSIVLEDFEKYSDKDNIFNTWLLRDDDKKSSSGTYKVSEENGNKFLSAVSAGNSIQIAKKVSWDIRSMPVLSWKWRITILPENANEKAKGKNDSGASIYVIFQRSRIPFLPWQYQPINVIKYVWSSNLPIDHIVYKKKTKLGNIIYEGYFYVIESGSGNTGKWITEERNVLSDYRKVFKESPKNNPYLIAILSDSNDTKSNAAADYDDIIIKKADDK
ncbi:MAG: DUF3047 domain-containing protein [Spirochaetes bacterium]|nr:DUF3047 domain-containing protein [Spirochaetota bacterium]